MSVGPTSTPPNSGATGLSLYLVSKLTHHHHLSLSPPLSLSSLHFILNFSINNSKSSPLPKFQLPISYLTLSKKIKRKKIKFPYFLSFYCKQKIMKGDFAHPKTKTSNMLSKFHLTHPFTHPTHQPDSDISPSAADGSTIEVVRRPRGRPPGSKNKPKAPLVLTREPEPAMRPYVLEVPGGNDVVEAIARFCRRKNLGLCVLNGSGTVANVSLRQPSTTPGATVTFHGRFEILSIGATVLPQTTPYPVPNGFTISLAGPQGQIVGGLVAGALIAAGTVFIVASSFNNPFYHRLPDEEEVKNLGSAGSGGEGHSPHISGGGDSSGHGQGHGQPMVESCGVAMYSCHAPSDVIWAPAARQPPPPHPPY